MPRGRGKSDVALPAPPLPPTAPARSTMLNCATRERVIASRFSVASTTSVKTECDRLLSRFIAVAATERLRLPRAHRACAAAADETVCSETPSM